MFDSALGSSDNFERAIDDEVNVLVGKGSKFLLIFTSVTTSVMVGLHYSSLVHDVLLPTSASVFYMLYALLLFLLSRKNLVRGKNKIYVILPLTLSPFLLFLVSQYTTPYGAATYLNAPIVFAYFIALIFTGFIFDLKLTLLLGVVYSIEFYASYLLGKEGIENISVPDSLMLQTLTSPHIYAIKGILIMLGSVLVGLLAVNSRRLIRNILVKEKEKESIDRVLSQYVSPSVKSRITEQLGEEKGQRKESAVLITDLRSFTSYVENHDVDMVIRQLNEYFGRMIDCIERNHGVVHNFIGDCIMAVFGGLVDLDNSCDSALKACDDMMHELKHLNNEWKGAGLETFRIGVGLHYGEVVLGTIGGDTRKEYAVIGDVVNTASRLESLTKEYGFAAICSMAFHNRLSEGSKRRAVDLGSAEIKGKKKEVSIFGFNYQ